MTWQVNHISSQSMCHIVGITYRELDMWTRAGHVTPSIEAAGSGTRRLWHRSQVGEVAYVKALKRESKILLARRRR